ncbi:hypothetical protein AHAS_Ahas06G0144200 [Arachis hypogaea]
MCGPLASLLRTLFSLLHFLSLLSPLQLPLATLSATLRQRCPPQFSSKVCVKSPVSYFIGSNGVAPSVFTHVGRAAGATPFVAGLVSLLCRLGRLPSSFSLFHLIFIF